MFVGIFKAMEFKGDLDTLSYNAVHQSKDLVERLNSVPDVNLSFKHALGKTVEDVAEVINKQVAYQIECKKLNPSDFKFCFKYVKVGDDSSFWPPDRSSDWIQLKADKS